jgi:hypothetical protein
MLLAIGIAMVVVAIAWRTRDLRRRTDGVAGALRSSDPGTRTRALREIAAVGLRPWVATLLDRTSEVGDGAEADELVWLIGACQWEPADEPAIVQLRLWAARRLVGAQSVTIPDPEPAPVVATEPEPVEGIATETPEEEAPQVDAPVVATRPAVVEEIEDIVGTRVLALSFVPLTQSGL